MSNAVVSINESQNIFVIPCGGGVSCMGFDYLFDQLNMLANKLKLTPPKKKDKGTIKQYKEYQHALTALSNIGGVKTTWFSLKTPAEVKRILEDYRQTDEKLRVYYGDSATGRDWLEENDVVGHIGRSSGLLKVPLLISEDEYGGPSLLDDAIVKIQDARTGETLYQHKDYHQPEMEIVHANSVEELPFEVHTNGSVHARFKTMGKAAGWIAFMTGECMRNPT